MAKNAAALATAFFNKEENKEFKESFDLLKPTHKTPFHGMFGEGKLSQNEEDNIKDILNKNILREANESEVKQDFQMLTQLTGEIKAISNQSILLHGERIKKAQTILKNYKDGAFTDWLIATYGNRRSPYTMLQYFEFYNQLPNDMRPLIELIPKRAAYFLASRSGELEHKLEIIQDYKGEKQSDVVARIQEKFPLHEKDKRSKTADSYSMLVELEKLIKKIDEKKMLFTGTDKMRLAKIVETLSHIVNLG